MHSEDKHISNENILFIIEQSINPFYTMAVDEYLLNLANQDKITGAFRFYTWKPYSISIGKFLKTTKFDLAKIKKNHILIVRRITGGNAIFHRNDLSYSFLLKKGLFNITDKKKLYLFLGEIFIRSLRKLDIIAKINLIPNIYKNNVDCFSSVSQYEIIDNFNNKIIASAQKLERNAFLQQGSFYPHTNNNLIPYLLDNKDFDEENSRDISNKPVFNNKIFDVSKDDFIDNIKNILSSKIELIEYKFNDEDKKEINLLIQQKYSTDEWNLSK